MQCMGVFLLESKHASMSIVLCASMAEYCNRCHLDEVASSVEVPDVTCAFLVLLQVGCHGI